MVSDSTRPQRPPRTPLATLAAWLEEAVGVRVAGAAEGVAVTGMSLSSQRIRRGDLYAALPGTRAHGMDFAAAAVAAGAVAVLTDEAGAAAAAVDVPVLVVDRPRAVLGALAARVYGEPAESMRMIGVTGTQGKTTTTRLLEGGLTTVGDTAAVIGTVGTRVAGEDVPTVLTTPEAPDLHGLFAMMRERGVTTCAMEVSSHALVMGRVDGVVFDVAVFLNLGRDHLDFHADVEDYFRAKASLFTPARARLGLVNVDDDHGRRLVTEAGVPVRTFSTGGDADWTVEDVELGPEGSTFVVVAPDGRRIAARCPLPGDFNVANTLAAVAAAGEAGLDPAVVAAGIAAADGVPGRLERVDLGQDFLVVVDYAHKPDAVEAAIRTLRPLTEGRVIVVLGAGGDRDPGKRPIMAAIAARLADLLVVTDDNPRTEDPASIRAAMLAGVAGPAEVLEVGDRRAAIREAVRRARPGDIVLVAGKGHETGQEIDGVVHPFDDREVAREELACLP
ncbi:UDP-N-acetylmuramoyl-L-alanyl-D-glutamate--2,6-diaminopimelate ligase [Nocardioides sp. YIM 152315]|uniref:UDP-N-acetylmuramoyl-L-alanyl-D-glutamate--2, 6-diaminopimelate ligase n=1 Tax=Nocardioides sp. YIM 152315 TaxID=3031760 RepID=UPI0023DBE901|nr:UDP-N-acetylmuramoyl-L-alanyl-D-glutamate--2,6-diaminopimelate ligase [Nocardioides sp. YIM 152315]MDF1603068.1 UDP-N-acetylmuramoyl-L-alanyl-D-glutamate--2,6-diaminopimelate ligase [Nocardioides sp. YIM 152315]